MQERKRLQRNIHAKKLHAKKPAKFKEDILPSEMQALLIKEKRRFNAAFFAKMQALIAKEQERLNAAFFDAVRANKKTEISQLINAGADIAAKGKYEGTALHEAAANITNDKPCASLCAFLIEQYTKSRGNAKEFIAAKDRFDRTALFEAAGYIHIETCALLIKKYMEAGGNVKELITTTDNNGMTPISIAKSFVRGQKTAQFLESMNLYENMGKEAFNLFMKSFNKCIAV